MRQFESIFGKQEGNIFCIKVLRHVPCVREHGKEQTLKGFLRKEEVMQHFAHDGFKWAQWKFWKGDKSEKWNLIIGYTDKRM